MDFTLTETGFLSILAMVMGFALACCKGIQQSRCNTISSPCLSCERQVLSGDEIIEMSKLGGSPPYDAGGLAENALPQKI